MVGPAGQDPWKLLHKRVARQHTANGKVHGAGGKRVHQGPRGLERLERTVLSFLVAQGEEMPRTLEELLERAHCDVARLRHCPWYRELTLPLPVHCDKGAIELQGHLLARELERAGIQVLGIALRPADAREFTPLLAATATKADGHLAASGEVIARLLRTLPHGPHAAADRAASRMRYATELARLVIGASVRTVHEDQQRSTYL